MKAVELLLMLYKAVLTFQSDHSFKSASDAECVGLWNYFLLPAVFLQGKFSECQLLPIRATLYFKI